MEKLFQNISEIKTTSLITFFLNFNPKTNLIDAKLLSSAYSTVGLAKKWQYTHL